MSVTCISFKCLMTDESDTTIDGNSELRSFFSMQLSDPQVSVKESIHTVR